jgi:transcriptional/translational regulatory protein YebC/TACO1
LRWKKATLQRIPSNAMEFTEEQLTVIEKLIDRLKTMMMYRQFYTNIA